MKTESIYIKKQNKKIEAIDILCGNTESLINKDRLRMLQRLIYFFKKAEKLYQFRPKEFDLEEIEHLINVFARNGFKSWGKHE